MSKIDLSSLTSEIDSIGALLNDSQEAKKASTALLKKEQVEALIIESLRYFYNTVYETNKSDTFIKGRSTRVSDSKFKKAIDSFAYGISISDILFYTNKSFPFGAKEGMIITCEKIYYNSGKEKGIVEIAKLDKIYTERRVGGNRIRLTDVDDNEYELGHMASLKEDLDAFDKSFNKLISGLKEMKNG